MNSVTSFKGFIGYPYFNIIIATMVARDEYNISLFSMRVLLGMHGISMRVFFNYDV